CTGGGRDTAAVTTSARAVEIPVCYGGEFGPDLEAVAALRDLEPSEVARLHAQSEYVVCFLGFTPGFAYLGGLPPALATPRLPAPRTRVPAGSVALGGAQTRGYPIDTPGGWGLFGRTPLRMFAAGRGLPAAFQTGGPRGLPA